MWIVIIPFLIGAILRSVWKPGADKITKWLNLYLIWFGLPLMTLKSLVKTKIPDYSIPGIALVWIILLTVINYFWAKRLDIDELKKSSWYLCSTFSNVAYIGFPVALILFGDEGVRNMGLITVVLSVFHYTIGVILAQSLSKKESTPWRHLMLSPLFFTTVIAFAISFMITALPDWLITIAEYSSPIAPLVVGLSFVPAIPKIQQLALARFVASPIIAILIALIASQPRSALLFWWFATSLPPAFSNVVVSGKYGFDPEYASLITSFSTAIFLGVIFAGYAIFPLIMNG